MARKNAGKGRKRKDRSPSVSRDEYEDKLTQYNRRVASVKSDVGRLQSEEIDAKAALDRARQKRRDVLGVHCRKVLEEQMAIDRCEADKLQLNTRLTALRAELDAVSERRQAQYDRALADLETRRDFVMNTYLSRVEVNRRRTLMGKMRKKENYIADLLEKQREGVYAVERSLVCRIVKLNYEQEKGFGTMSETVIMNFANDQIRNISEYYRLIKEINENRKENARIKKAIKDFIEKYQIIKKKTYVEETKILSESINLLDERIYRLSKQKESAEMDKKQLLTLLVQPDEKNDEKSLNDFEEEKEKITNLKQQITVAGELRKEKNNHLKIINEEIKVIANTLKNYINGQNQLLDTPDNMEWLLKMTPLMLFKIIKVDF